MLQEVLHMKRRCSPIEVLLREREETDGMRRATPRAAAAAACPRARAYAHGGMYVESSVAAPVMPTRNAMPRARRHAAHAANGAPRATLFHGIAPPCNAKCPGKSKHAQSSQRQKQERAKPSPAKAAPRLKREGSMPPLSVRVAAQMRYKSNMKRAKAMPCHDHQERLR